jgi:hypothetical protein
MHIQTQICKKSGLINAHSNPNMQKKWFNQCTFKIEYAKKVINQCKFIFEYAEKVNLNSISRSKNVEIYNWDVKNTFLYHSFYIFYIKFMLWYQWRS